MSFLRVATSALRRPALLSAVRAAAASGHAAKTVVEAAAPGQSGVIQGVEGETGWAAYQQKELARGNPDPFYMNLASRHFGSYDRPHLVPSFLPERVIGCQGGTGHDGEPRPHETLWYKLENDEHLECSECGQVFELVELECPFPPLPESH
eukprot:comp21480_c0_seq1/m.29740 comp21480_c0_seq1/g.29740  ORF comp21480_c0_seq1/g.29740 comp21480_c0_seq1/m.29740 type:complete len:151 (-) comp21480_c0_seq1:145-597(-)